MLRDPWRGWRETYVWSGIPATIAPRLGSLYGFLGVSSADMVIGNKFSVFQAIRPLFRPRARCAVDGSVFDSQ